MDNNTSCSSSVTTITEQCMKEMLRIRTPLCEDGVAERFSVAPGKPQTETEEKALVAQKHFCLENTKHAFVALAEGRRSDAYLALQPIFVIAKGDNVLWGFEVLARVKNGKDAAPMPFLASWQVEDRIGAMKFLEHQLDFARDAAAEFPGRNVTVNVRPDEITGASGKILEVAKQQRGIIIELTEYSAIDDDVLLMVAHLQQQGVRFALDDVSKAVEVPKHGYVKEGQHPCTFEFGKKNAHLFEVQKLALPLSSVVFRVPVFPTPEFDGGKPNPFFQSQMIEHQEGGKISQEILERKQETENWTHEVSAVQPTTTFIIECSLHERDLEGKDGLIPDIDLFDGRFCTQGADFGGRGFTFEAIKQMFAECKL